MFAILVFCQRSYTCAWHVLQAADPVYGALEAPDTPTISQTTLIDQLTIRMAYSVGTESEKKLK